MMYRSFILTLLLAVPPLAATFAPPVSAVATLSRAVADRGERRDEPSTIPLLRERLEANPDDAGAWYALAAALAQGGDLDAGADALLSAVKAGYREFAKIRRDPELAPLHDHPLYEAILEAVDRVEAERPNLAREALAAWRAEFGDEGYRETHDEARRLIYLTALDERGHSAMRDMIDPQADYLIHALFEAPPRDQVLVVIPDPADARRLFDRENIGGSYEHRRRRLVARDTGMSLRHEIVHVLHYGHMERLGQPHALWVQEGLAALFEDYDWTEDGSIRFLPNERHNVIRRRVRANMALDWPTLFELPADRFMARSGALYPQARSIFEFLAAEDRLEPWYRAYVRRFEDDRTGAQAFEEVFGQSLADIEARWRRWVMDRPEVERIIEPGDPSLGIETAPNVSNDGVLVTRLLQRPIGSGGLRIGDVIVDIDGRPTPTLADLRRELSGRSVGDRVRLKVRRGERYATIPVTLRAFSVDSFDSSAFDAPAAH